MTAVVQHPRAVELVERRKLRKKVERAVSRLIAILDDLDSDPEAEPWLGARVVLYPEHYDQRLWATGANDDREQEDEHGGDILDGGDDDQVDAEPSLGAAENVDQTRWSQGGRRDLEFVGEDRRTELGCCSASTEKCGRFMDPAAEVANASVRLSCDPHRASTPRPRRTTIGRSAVFRLGLS